jgi:alkylation response protein AidB-like acyl-CoA dehydrogenase
MSTSIDIGAERAVEAFHASAAAGTTTRARVTRELHARTMQGALAEALVDNLAPSLEERAAEGDATGAFPTDSVHALRDSGILAAPAPSDLGGLGVETLHDLVVLASRIARADASLGIGVNMHLVFLHNVALRRRQALAHGQERRASAFTALLETLVEQRAILAAAVSEPAQDVTRPSTRATRDGTGWRIDGRKIFCTMAPAATHLYTAVTFAGEDGIDRYGYALVPANTPGVVVHDDWDALGMRASGSHSVGFDGAWVPLSALPGGFHAGDAVAYMERNLAAGLFHAAASLGIAEAAQGRAVATLARRSGGDGRERLLLAENEVDLAAARRLLGGAAALLDEHEHVASGGAGDEIVALFAEAQAAKTFLNATAERVADRSLGIAGGAGYLTANPLSRLYRDARAGAFMHPLGANRAYELLAAVALDETVELR